MRNRPRHGASGHDGDGGTMFGNKKKLEGHLSREGGIVAWATITS